MYEIWKLYVENLLKLLCQNQSVDKVQLWPWPLTPKCLGIFLSPFNIYVWNLYVENYINVSEPKYWQSSVVTLTFGRSHHFASMYKSCTVKSTQVVVFMSESKCWQSSVVTLTFGTQNVWTSASHYPASMHELWKLYVGNYSSHCVRTKVLTDRRTDNSDS